MLDRPYCARTSMTNSETNSVRVHRYKLMALRELKQKPASWRRKSRRINSPIRKRHSLVGEYADARLN
ncbi:hypothetical protein KCP78_21225 [Salmonella enterica subsp. enterica]|nr:hypothetical protein KCP78_21225 [Salmonella enterica subsp. enterica]